MIKPSVNAARIPQNLFESLILHSADAIWIIDLNELVLDVNPAFEKLFGWPAHEVLGQPLPIIPDLLKPSMFNIHESIKNGEPVASFETVRLKKDGSLLDVEATLSPLRDRTGEIIGITGICRDITRRKKAETELKSATELLESFIENNADPIIFINVQGIIFRVNEPFEKIFGWSKNEVIGQNFLTLNFMPPDALEEALTIRNKIALDGDVVVGLETERKRKDGSIIDVSLTASPILDMNGAVNGWAVVMRDITEWKKAQDQYQFSEKLTVAGQLAVGIAHEIRNPVTAIKGFIHLMKAGFGEKKKYYDIMTSEIERIELILNELLILSKPQSVKFERKDVRVLLNQVLALLDSQAILHNVEFETDFPSRVPHLYCDENQLKQVFINFIKNAMESMPKGGKITITMLNCDDQALTIRFRDQGCGIPEKILAKLGQPFFTTKEKGTGLGFMISKKIIENHSGSVHIESEIDKGTTIEVKFPISPVNGN